MMCHQFKGKTFAGRVICESGSIGLNMASQISGSGSVLDHHSRIEHDCVGSCSGCPVPAPLSLPAVQPYSNLHASKRGHAPSPKTTHRRNKQPQCYLLGLLKRGYIPRTKDVILIMAAKLLSFSKSRVVVVLVVLSTI